MTNWRPKGTTIAAAANDSGTIVAQNVSTTTWGLALLKGTAHGAGGTALGSATVLVWESGTATTATANHTTFSDVNGRYGVTVRAGYGLTIKAYAK
ncbi:hypothetical protein [Clostridium sp.]|uniref:hypothetical protein n=1 Tax=Clostridium sp. TaxID=1506 RepID=UPI002840DAE0|nr:hypothetical protein [Clostridium sp.]MDR3594082.1 hypothetical protein [Clostridium sp.]